ncbi:L-aspartate oxidase [Oscillospiraceae bacterium OttesenSCG-928-F05]|nr:L-aspartate oxidase [Oscillospiraceae bacterium OttesenSCG-928-F05]
MKRYAFDSSAQINGTLKFDVLIVGSGVAGLYTAMHIDPSLSCAILTKEGVDLSNSWLAQGGIAAAISADDTPRLHFSDTLMAGAGLCDEEAVRILVDEGPADIRRLVSMEVPFDLSDEGDLQITREGGHTRRRVVHAGGDATGRETVKVLASLAARRSNVTFLQRAFFVDLLTDEKGVCGALINDGGFKQIATRNICLCTGGIGQVYLHSTNPSVATGDGIAAAVRAGAKLSHMEFIQFHPTALYLPSDGGRSFLISEAVRGEGAILRNHSGKAFMQGQHPMADLAPRDIVARAIDSEMRRTGKPHMWLDATMMKKDFVERHFPTIYGECLLHGIDITKDYIPVRPVQHYMIGGVETDLNGMTTVHGLYACGEAAHTGVHGANRLASNSMLECLVFGRRAAGQINDTVTGREPKETAAVDPGVRDGESFDPESVKREIQTLMDKFGGVRRTGPGLAEGISALSALFDKIDRAPLPTKAHVEALNVATVALEILRAAAGRPESVGAHYIETPK